MSTPDVRPGRPVGPERIGRVRPGSMAGERGPASDTDRSRGGPDGPAYDGRRADHRRQPRAIASAPKGLDPADLRPRPRGAFNLIGPVDDAAVLDLFAGSGAMGLEALSRGAARAVFVESDREACRTINANLDKLAAHGARSSARTSCARSRASARHLRPRALRPALRALADHDRLAPHLAALLAARRPARLREPRARARAGARRASTCAPPASTAPRGLPSSSLMITAICPGSYDPVTNGHVDVIRARRAIFDRVVVGVVARPAAQDAAVPGRGARRVPPRRARRHRQRRGRRLPRARRRVRPPLGGEGDRQGPARDLRLRVGVPDEPPEPHARARRSRRST